jgi:hypothetical protein
MVANLDLSISKITPIRIVLANMPEVVLRLTEEAIQSQPDMRVVQVAHNLVELLVMAKEADLVLIGAKAVYPPPGIISHLVSEFPFVKIVVLASEGEESAGYLLGLQHIALTIDSTQDLVKTIRQLHSRDVMD